MLMLLAAITESSHLITVRPTRAICARSSLLCVRESSITSDKIIVKQHLVGLINITSALEQKQNINSYECTTSLLFWSANAKAITNSVKHASRSIWSVRTGIESNLHLLTNHLKAWGTICYLTSNKTSTLHIEQQCQFDAQWDRRLKATTPLFAHPTICGRLTGQKQMKRPFLRSFTPATSCTSQMHTACLHPLPPQ